jgi:hypothetical protein
VKKVFEERDAKLGAQLKKLKEEISANLKKAPLKKPKKVKKTMKYHRPIKRN